MKYTQHISFALLRWEFKNKPRDLEDTLKYCTYVVTVSKRTETSMWSVTANINSLDDVVRFILKYA